MSRHKNGLLMNNDNLIANCFPDYQLLDSGSGNKLEIISGVKVVRPSPQAIWNEMVKQDSWKEATSRCIRKKDGGGTWEHKKGDPSPLQLKWKSESEMEYLFKLKFTSFGHCGIFFEQSAIWNRVEKLIQVQRQKKKNPVFLNLFGYTGAASIIAAKNGATVYHIDSAKGVLDWGRENQSLNSIPNDRIKWFHSDVIRFLQNSVKRGEVFDGILADPPSWGHGAKKEVWEFDKQIAELVELLKKVMSNENYFCLLSCHTHGVQNFALMNLMNQNFKNGKAIAGEVAIKHANDARLLPAGIYSLASDLI